jgi:WD40 repeat protein
MSALRLGGLALAALAVALVLGCSGAGPSAPADDSIVTSIGDVQIEGASGLTRVNVPASSYGTMAFTGFYGTSITRFAQIGTGRICFSTTRYGATDEICVARPDGYGLTRITNNTDHDEYPDWSPDGQTIAFATSRNTGRTIYTMKADGSLPTRITTTTVQDTMPCWSPDGKSMVFASYRDGNYEIYTMGATGTNQTRLTNDAGVDTDPDWSPDNTAIAFATDRGGSMDIYRMATDGSNPVAVTSTADDDVDPAWSPDGSRIAYSRLAGMSGGNIRVCYPDGTNDVALTNDVQGNRQPEWSPDGSQIMFRRGSELWAMDSDGDNPHAITTGAGELEASASWSGSTAHVARSLIGSAGSDGGADPPFGTSRPLVIVGMDYDGLAEAVSVSIPEIHWGTVSASGLDGTGMYLSAVQIEAARVDGVQEDVGRGVAPRYWNTSSGLITKSVVVFFSTMTGRITSIFATTVAASAAEATPTPTVRLEGDRVVVSGPFDAVWTAPGENATPSGAREVEVDASTGEVLAVR